MKNNFMLSRPKYNGKFLLRVVMGNYNTKESHLEDLLNILIFKMNLSKSKS